MLLTNWFNMKHAAHVSRYPEYSDLSGLGLEKLCYLADDLHLNVTIYFLSISEIICAFGKKSWDYASNERRSCPGNVIR